ncbi:MAG TPA: DGQHR domain-containing protein [Blastocatellia bacterium]|nr:DGQHR domain-containing protein [Blastocatellia bacterium]
MNRHLFNFQLSAGHLQDLNFSVIDGQHRINAAYLAVCILRENDPNAEWEIPAEIFLDLDKKGDAPRRQAQIFIDVNYNQKKVDRSLVADLFPTARGSDASTKPERAQDLGRKLMLETGPLVGMIQIPGIKFGVKDVVTLATLNKAVEAVLDDLDHAKIETLDEQAEFLSLCLEAWFEATGRKEEVIGTGLLDPDNVAYQGRVVVSFLTLIPWCLLKLKTAQIQYISDKTTPFLADLLRGVMRRARLLTNKQFIPKKIFKQEGYLGSGGLARFRDTLWTAAVASKVIGDFSHEELAELASTARAKVRIGLADGN